MAKMKSLITFFVVLVSIILVGCSGEYKPATSGLKTALIQSLPSHMEVKSFSVQASENLGNKVEPIYGSRFQATVATMVDLYKIDTQDKRVTFVRLFTEKGKQTDIFGKIISRLYQGAWKHYSDIEGNPIGNLGEPLNQIFDDRVIVRGSDEEKKYYAEIESERVRMTQCVSNLKSIWISLICYANEHEERFPEKFSDLYPEFVNEESLKIFFYPDEKKEISLLKILLHTDALNIWAWA